MQTQSDISKQIVLKLPIILTFIYLTFSLIVYVLCPYQWETKRPILFWTLNALYIAALVFGYFVGQNHVFQLRKISWTEKTTNQLISLLPFFCTANCVMYLIYIFRSYGFSTFDFAGLAEQLTIGLKNPGLGYYLHCMRQITVDGLDVIGGHTFTVLNLLWGFIRIPIMLFSMLHFRQMNLWGKISALLYLIMVVIFYISIGTNIQFLHVLLIILLPIILRTFDLWYAGTIRKQDVLILAVSLLTGFLLLTGYFSWMTESRANTYGYEIADYKVAEYSIQNPDVSQQPSESSQDPNISQQPETPPKKELTGLAKKLNNLWISGSSYLSQGYYAMSLSLTQKWTPMFGLGNSKFVMDLISDHMIDIRQYTYQSKLEKYGWSSTNHWHSIYTWLANDVSFYGVIVVMFLIGAIFAMMFQDAIVTKNPLARASIFFYILMLLFIPCNNQIAQSNENLCGFSLLVLLWILCGKTD